MLARAHETERDVMFFFIFFFGGQPSVEQAKFASVTAVANRPSNLVLKILVPSLHAHETERDVTFIYPFELNCINQKKIVQ